MHQQLVNLGLVQAPNILTVYRAQVIADRHFAALGSRHSRHQLLHNDVEMSCEQP